jgi:hypothetical protein
MTDKNIINARKVGGDYFRLYHVRKGGKSLQFYLDKFNFNCYLIYKQSRHQKKVEYSEVLDFNSAGYLFYRKDLFDEKQIQIWLDYLKDIGGIQFLNKPLPPFNPDKIIIRK